RLARAVLVEDQSPPCSSQRRIEKRDRQKGRFYFLCLPTGVTNVECPLFFPDRTGPISECPGQCSAARESVWTSPTHAFDGRVGDIVIPTDSTMPGQHAPIPDRSGIRQSSH